MATVVPTVVLERDVELAALSQAVARAAAGHGSVALVSGEAGIGKSSVLAAMRAALPADARFLLGRCDDLTTPRVLGPFRDLAGSVGVGLSRALREYGDRDALYAALLEELGWAGHATVLAVEDVHWADEATFDVLRFLVRRVSELPVVLVLTWRDDVDRHHPMRQLVALTSTDATVLRLPLAPLSARAVEELAAGGRATVDARAVHALTGGNPFFVHEVVASGAEGVPVTVVDSLLARLRRLSPAGTGAVEQLSVLTSRIDHGLVDALVPGGLGALVEAEEHGLIEVSPTTVAFRHELGRRAVVDSLPVSRRAALNAAALAALAARPAADPAQLVHHAREAGDTAALLRHGPEAARSAAAAGAHREALAHYEQVLAHREEFEPASRADLLPGSAIEHYLAAGPTTTAIESQADSVALRRTLGDRVALGVALRWLSRLYWWYGDIPAAEAAGREAVHVLADTDSPSDLALALSNASQLAMLAWRNDEAAELAARAARLARELGDDAVLSHALNNLGTARWAAGDVTGRALLEESLAVAQRAGLTEHASRAYCNLAFNHVLALDLPAAERAATAGIAHAEGAEHVGFGTYLHVLLGWTYLHLGRWDDAVRCASVGLDTTSHIRCTALSVLGSVAVRRGEDARPLVDEALAMGREIGELMRIAPAAAAAAEAAWLRGDAPGVREAARAALALSVELDSPSWRAELGHWLALVGEDVDLSGVDHPWADLARGDWRTAARRWGELGCPYERGLALARSEDPTDLLAALTAFDTLGAAPMAHRVRTRLRDLGVERIPRGPLPATRTNPAGLTARQLDVLSLVAAGLSNADIADRLVLSVRTVDHHVAAVMDKLGAGSRHDAVTRARSLGWSPDTSG